jgi:hypothetical protein
VQPAVFAAERLPHSHIYRTSGLDHADYDVWIGVAAMTTGTRLADSEQLRGLLVRLDSAGAGAWRDDPEADELMRFTTRKYAALARKNRLPPEDAAVAAFEAMRTRAVCEADDPWAVVTRAVQRALTYEVRAHGLLCSVARARQGGLSDFHDAERFSDRDHNLCDYHPAFHTPAAHDSPELDEPDSRVGEGERPVNAYVAVDDAVRLFTECGWPDSTAWQALEYICARLAEAGTRARAFEALRRDGRGRASLGIGQYPWSLMLRAVLGNQHPDARRTSDGRGLLLRLVMGYSLDNLRSDERLRDLIVGSCPDLAGSIHG